MYHGKRLLIRNQTKLKHMLDACNKASAEVWNLCLQKAKDHHLATGKWIGKNQLQTETKQTVALHSQSIQAVAHKYLNARLAAKEAKTAGRKDVRYPYKEKFFFNTKWVGKAFSIEGNVVTLSLGIRNGKRQPPLKLQVSGLDGIAVKTIKEVELCHDTHYYLSITYDDGIENPPLKQQQAASVDLGEIHSIASFAEDGASVLISGRKVRSIHQLRNKKLAELQRLQSKCKKGSRQWKKYQKAKNFVRTKSTRQLQDALHKTTKNFVDWCVAQQVSTVYVGDVEGVERNTKGKKRKKVTQKLSNWSFGKLMAYLTYKARTEGIDIQKVDEAYSTQTCPVCHTRKKHNGRNVRCSCGYTSHRDIHGAKNILSKTLYGDFLPWAVEEQTKYLRPC
jgi:putative transposase